MTLADAKRRIADYGTPLGAVAPGLSDADRASLAAWFVAEKKVPNLAARKETAGPGGNMCRCGGFMVRTGTCETCQSCGESSGGCG